MGTNRPGGIALDAGPADDRRPQRRQLGHLPRHHSRALAARVLRPALGLTGGARHLPGRRRQVQLFRLVPLELVDDDAVRLAAPHDAGRAAGGQPVRREHQEPVLPTSGPRAASGPDANPVRVVSGGARLAGTVQPGHDHVDAHSGQFARRSRRRRRRRRWSRTRRPPWAPRPSRNYRYLLPER
uniref:(northern house mosquito) hypothetical protein n=1 Tax=Culex pipiens TaxID=7175 RepID=A0A8D8GEF9_CULPI